MPEAFDIAVIGAGAAGLMASIWAGRTIAAARSEPARRIVLLDGARTLGAKILVAGGGRCNVTHFEVSERDYSGSTPPAIRNVLARFPVARTIDFFRELGVELKREETGKLFPVTDSARTVLSALLSAALDAGVEMRHPWRVARIERDADSFILHPQPPGSPHPAHGAPADADVLRARRVILATGGMALPRSGSDGAGYDLARALGHSTTARIFPALVPILLSESCPLRDLSGIAAPGVLSLHDPDGRLLADVRGPVLFTHFGLSGPAALDISRHLLDARHAGLAPTLRLNLVDGAPGSEIEAALHRAGGEPVGRLLVRLWGFAQRLSATLCASAAIDPGTSTAAVPREARRSLAQALASMELPVTGDRGFSFAEATAGGIPLREVNLRTMESRTCPGLHLCGEILDVDGRIGGFNFQWAWSSGFVAGSAASAP
ncbi:MAG: NAD(P)/FAD-dependent oxidoreductase [Phycisphaerales bacterium]|nr:NAD(P)/FAD-dependent oxidoreductase [Phycisphaerales bacterium]